MSLFGPKKVVTFLIPDQPEVYTSVSPAIVEEGSSAHYQCSASSTSAPTSHNLTIFTSWHINGRYIETTSRYRVENNTLDIYSMTRTDDGLVVTCEAREDTGLTALSNISVTMSCK